MLHVSFTIYFKNSTDVKTAVKVIKKLEGRSEVVSAIQLSNQHGGIVYQFTVAESRAEGFQDAVRGEKTIREFGRSDRQES